MSLTTMAPYLLRFSQLRCLVLGASATDAALCCVGRALSSVEEIDISHSKVTDAGLDDGLVHAHNLRRLIGTYCPRLSYNATLRLRRALAADASSGTGPLEVVRLPSWLTGRFFTPWGEVHAYFPDGTFCFDRAEQSTGYVRGLRQVSVEGENEMVADSLQYIDFEPPPTWPDWTRYIYRPGVLARRPDPADEMIIDASGRPKRSVYIMQNMSSPAAPLAPPAVRWSEVPVGGRVYIDNDGNFAPPASADEADSIPRGFEFMLSCMLVEPLPPDGTQPPDELLQRIEAFERRREADQLSEEVLATLFVAMTVHE